MRRPTHRQAIPHDRTERLAQAVALADVQAVRAFPEAERRRFARAHPSLLGLVVRRGSLEWLDEVLSHGADPNAGAPFRGSLATRVRPLTVAVQDGNRPFADRLVKAGACWCPPGEPGPSTPFFALLKRQGSTPDPAWFADVQANPGVAAFRWPDGVLDAGLFAPEHLPWLLAQGASLSRVPDLPLWLGWSFTTDASLKERVFEALDHQARLPHVRRVKGQARPHLAWPATELMLDAINRHDTVTFDLIRRRRPDHRPALAWEAASRSATSVWLGRLAADRFELPQGDVARAALILEALKHRPADLVGRAPGSVPILWWLARSPEVLALPQVERALEAVSAPSQAFLRSLCAHQSLAQGTPSVDPPSRRPVRL